MIKLLRRRKIGPAYERCPAERMWDWGRTNLLILISTAIGVFLWWWAVTALIAFFNWLQTEGRPDQVPPFDPDAWYAIVARLVGAVIILLIMIVKSRR